MIFGQFTATLTGFITFGLVIGYSEFFRNKKMGITSGNSRFSQALNKLINDNLRESIRLDTNKERCMILCQAEVVNCSDSNPSYVKINPRCCRELQKYSQQNLN